MGRPLKTELPRDKKLTLALSEKEVKEIGECAKLLGKPRVDAILAGVRLLKKEFNK